MRALAREPADRFPDAGALAEALRVWRRNPDAVQHVVPGAAAAAAAAAAATPPAGEPTVYVPPRVTRPADRRPALPPPTRVDVRPTQRRAGQRWWTWLLAVLGVFLLGAIGFLAVQLLGGGEPGPSPAASAATITVPNCDNVALTTLRQQAAELEVQLDPRDEPSDEIAEGRVIRCEPESGEPLPEGGTLIAYVSTGSEDVAVPRLRGQTLQQAQQTLSDEGLRVGAIDQEFDPSVPAGSVVRSDPPEGREVATGSQVDLVVSLGPTPTPSPSPTPTPTPEPTPTPTPTPTPILTLPPTPEPTE